LVGNSVRYASVLSLNQGEIPVPRNQELNYSISVFLGSVFNIFRLGFDIWYFVPDPVIGLRSAEHQILDWFVISGDRSTEQYR
jgi:hypothetical protein